jgi:hypothetical protein
LLGRTGNTGEAFDGLIAGPAHWDVILTASEAAALAAKAPPTSVRPASLRLYAPLVRDLVDLKGAVASSTDTTVEPHPPVTFAQSARIYSFPEAVSPVITGFDPAAPFTVGQTGVQILGTGFGA